MATYLATTTTLIALKQWILSQLGALDKQQSGILENELTDLIHNAICTIRQTFAAFLSDWYQTDATITWGTLTNNITTASLATTSIFDINGMILYDTILKVIPIKPTGEFRAIQQYYSVGASGNINATSGVARIKGAAPNPNSTLTLELLTGATTLGGTTTLTYPRVPIKVTDNDTVDIPEMYIPTVREFGILLVKKRIGHEVSIDAVNALKTNIEVLLTNLSFGTGENFKVKPNAQ